jgi:hypothetical protein
MIISAKFRELARGRISKKRNLPSATGQCLLGKRVSFADDCHNMGGAKPFRNEKYL